MNRDKPGCLTDLAVVIAVGVALLLIASLIR
jgi:hypothetical protein